MYAVPASLNVILYVIYKVLTVVNAICYDALPTSVYIYQHHTYNFALNERMKLFAADVIFVRKYKLH
jgi:hypothetical protein